VTITIDMKEFANYLKDDSTGLYWYAGKKVPISLENDPTLELAASQGSRYFNNERFYRSHDEMDFKSPYDTPVMSTINGTLMHNSVNGHVTVITDDKKYKVVFLHMPPLSFKDVGEDKKVNVGEPIGKVGGWGLNDGKYVNDAYGPHLHYEVWESRNVIVKANDRNQTIQMFVPIDPRLVDLSVYQNKGEGK
jgi:murein DD-endopeptidase MepM/ murein hydrolase activator NlpD